MHRLILASRNRHKTSEFIEILGKGFEVRDLTDRSELPPIAETGATYEANAILKAVETTMVVPGLIVADDSGLEVDALQGAPGIYSARYAGPNATDAENISKLLNQLSQTGTFEYRARFRCWLALAREGKLLGTFEGMVEGTIVRESRGETGFGYDPIFQPLGCDRTFAELTSAEKNRISHRGRAIRLLREALVESKQTG